MILTIALTLASPSAPCEPLQHTALPLSGNVATQRLGPALVGRALYRDLDRDGLVGSGDTLTLRFDEDVVITANNPLPVVFHSGTDSFGSMATVLAAGDPRDVTVVLGTGAAFKARQDFSIAATNAHPASGVGIGAAAGAIVSANTGSAARFTGFVDIVPDFVPSTVTGLGGATQLDWVDIDGNGDMDLVAVIPGVGVRMWRQNFLGVLQQWPGGFGSGQVRSIALGDIDHDGDIDVIEATATTSNSRVWLNDGTGTFQEGLELTAEAARHVVLGDVNNDGQQDIVLTLGTGTRRVFIGNGSGFFSQYFNTPTSSAGLVSLLVDVDGDGNLDLVAGNALDDQVWLGDGHGAFSESGQTLSSANSIALISKDLDHDGDPDIALLSRPGELQLWANDGTGVFSLSTSVSLGAIATSFAMADFDSDGDSDFFVGFATEALRVYTSQQPFDLQLVLGAATTPSVGSRALACADYDRDGDCDRIESQPGSGILWTGSLSGAWGGVEFVPTGQVMPARNTEAMAHADFDGDGDIDFIDGAYDQPKKLWLNDGTGQFVDSGLVLGQDLTRALAAGDLDQDGDIDWVEGTRFPTNPFSVFLQTGPLQFSLGQELFGGQPHNVTLADLDFDGDLDAVTSDDLANRVRYNNGDGSFATFGYEFGVAQTREVCLGDLDSDGDLDLVSANIGGYDSEVWINAGLGVFQQSQLLGASSGTSVALGDLDGDGDLDCWLGNVNNEPDSVWFNNGQGVFTASAQMFPISQTMSVDLVDLDGDGDLDAALAQGGQSNNQNPIWLNDGTGTFTLFSRMLGGGNTAVVWTADLDHDGDIDIVYGNDGQATAVFMNN